LAGFKILNGDNLFCFYSDQPVLKKPESLKPTSLRWCEIVSSASFGTKDKITVRLYNQSFYAPVSCLGSE
jgi:hypothetical protein